MESTEIKPLLEIDVGIRGGDFVKEVAEPVSKFFIAESYRKGQLEALTEIESAFNEGYKYVLLEAPTGVGKSHISRAFAFHSGYAVIITVQKMLQDQYGFDFPDMYVMKGRSSFKCLVPGRTCADGPCKTKKGFSHEDDCPYKKAIYESEASPVVVHNFDSYYYQSRAYKFALRNLMIIDECHNIENKFLNFMEFNISNKSDPTLDIPEYDTMEEYIPFLTKFQKRVREEILLLESQGSSDISVIRHIDDLTSLDNKISIFFFQVRLGMEYVFDYYRKEMLVSLTVRPVLVGGFVRKFFESRASKVLMMSATILDKRIFCDSIGLPLDDVKFIRLGSIFPAKNRPIKLTFSGSMSRKYIDRTLPVLYDDISRILDVHKGRKGIIHTHSERIAEGIRENVKDRRLTFNKDFYNLDEMLSVHSQKDGSFIVASGLREGLDLKGDLSKVQVICKIPYPSLGDKRIRRRMEIDEDWYGYITTLMFVQSLGRSIRSETDKAVTYILDSDFKRYYGMNKDFIPKYIKEAIIWR